MWLRPSVFGQKAPRVGASFGRTTGLRSTRIAENGNVSAFGLPARNETIPGRFSATKSHHVRTGGSKPTDAAAVRVKRLAHRAGTSLGLWTGAQMVSILCIVFSTAAAIDREGFGEVRLR